MERLTILVGQLNKSVGQTKYFFKVHLVGRFIPLVGLWNPGFICRVEMFIFLYFLYLLVPFYMLKYAQVMA